MLWNGPVCSITMLPDNSVKTARSERRYSSSTEGPAHLAAALIKTIPHKYAVFPPPFSLSVVVTFQFPLTRNFHLRTGEDEGSSETHEASQPATCFPTAAHAAPQGRWTNKEENTICPFAHTSLEIRGLVSLRLTKERKRGYLSSHIRWHSFHHRKVVKSQFRQNVDWLAETLYLP